MTDGHKFVIEVRPCIPTRLEGLERLANDLYFSWNRDVRRLFRHLDEDCWRVCGHNPRLFLRRVPQAHLEAAVNDPILYAEYRSVLAGYDTYLEGQAQPNTGSDLRRGVDRVAYFCAEFGFHQSMPIYAGGLGILAGDYCKAMSGLRAPFVGVGLLYHQGYFTQRLLADGTQEAEYIYSELGDLPVSPARDAEGKQLRIRLSLPDGPVQVAVWAVRVGHIQLFLLDTDVADNSPEQRQITAQLYGGGQEMRIRQEMVLGVGGVRALRALGLAVNVWHINEGHSAFQVLERCREYMVGGMDFDGALERAAADTVFTTHTPVPAGHDIFPRELAQTYLNSLAEPMGGDMQRLLDLGGKRGHLGGFNMTTLALRGSRFHNGVSRIHGTVAAHMEADLWPQVPPEENAVSYVTNGVDVDTWLGDSWLSLFDMYKGSGWRASIADEDFWRGFIKAIPTHAYRSARNVQKAALLDYCARRLHTQMCKNGLAEAQIRRRIRHLGLHDLDTLVLGFARRFATYKRATLLFRDLPRLARLLTNLECPVLLLFAGKAHPADGPGRALLREVARVAELPEFRGRLFLLEDYNISMARELVAGVDVWINTPEYPKEACGTSGMKAAINGALNVSVLDGWWGEAYQPGDEIGWAVTPHVDLSGEERDRREGEELLDVLEHEVIPLYFAHNADGEPEGWIRRSKASMYTVLPRFNSVRMATDYLRDYYSPAKAHGEALGRDGGLAAVRLAQWKRIVWQTWPAVRAALAEDLPEWAHSGDSLPIGCKVDLAGLSPQDVVVECVLEDGEDARSRVLRLEPQSEGEAEQVIFQGDLSTLGGPLYGLQRFRLRVYPYHPLLAHPLEMGCMYWI